jgi:ketosteroid isomerase-like protein
VHARRVLAGYSRQTMSQENVEVVRRVYEAVARGDTTAVLAAYDPDIEWEFTRSPFRSLFKHDVYHGHEGLRSFIRERYEEAWESIEDDLETLIEAGECVVSVVTTKGRGRASGVEVERKHAGLWTFRDGRIVRVAWFPTGEEALAAAGERE